MKHLITKHHKFYAGFVALTFVLLFSLTMTGDSQALEINWVEGPTNADLGKDVAEVQIGADYVFADAKDTRKIMELYGNPSSKSEVGLIMPKDEEATWYIVFDYNRIGYIRDDEKDSIDSSAILESIKEATEAANKKRVKDGFAPLNIIGWYEEPHYDKQSHNLVWTLLAESEGDQVVNYNVRLLGRQGYVSAVLVTDPATLDSLKPELNNIISTFSYKKGKSYAEFVKGDKVAKYGLTALIAGGAGTVAAKAGLFKLLGKAWKLVAVAAIGFFAAIWRAAKGLFSSGRQKYPLSNGEHQTG